MGSIDQILAGEVAVVTGAAQGNGAAIATGLCEHGAAVALADVDREGVERQAQSLIARGFSVGAHELDVADPEACRHVALEVRRLHGPASILINNAGVIRRVPASDPDLAHSFKVQFDVNVLGGVHMVQAFLDQLTATGGRIVNVGSIASFLATVGGAGYAASKGAVLQATRSLAAELAPRGIRVNAIAPGVIATAMTEATRQDPATAAAFLAHTPLNRFGQPEELVGPVIFLCSAMSSYVTGVMLPVDGGYLTK